MSKPRLIFVGGFLGAGKTTLLTEAARRLISRGKRVGLLANDQAPDLVDTELFKNTESPAEAVAGGCFCCRFPDMVAAVERLLRHAKIEIVLGEPVGSCTDLSATVLQPLKKLYSDRFELAPFSVVIDARQVGVLAHLQQADLATQSTPFPDQVLYIYQKQLEEADAILLNKTDLVSEAELHRLSEALSQKYPETSLFRMSARTGEGVETWLDFVCQARTAGGKIAQVDYDTYAAGEAALGWLNASAQLESSEPVNWHLFATDLLVSIRDELQSRGAEIAHVKLYLTTSGGHIATHLTSNQGPVQVWGRIASPHHAGSLLLNARVYGPPEMLRKVVEKTLHSTRDRIEIRSLTIRCFAPARPQPTYRYETVF